MRRLNLPRRLLASALICMVGLGAVVIAAAAVLATTVHGVSMLPTLHDGDRVLTRPGSGGKTPARFDVVIASFGPNEPLVVKRVIGLPGDRVEIVKSGVEPGVVRVQPAGQGPWRMVDNAAWTGRWGGAPSNCCSANGMASAAPTVQTVPAGMLLLIGDNPGQSEDSRTFGWAPITQVKGVLTWRVYPLDAIGSVSSDVMFAPPNP